MRYLKFLYLLLGVALLAVVLAEIDVAAVAERAVGIGWGLAVVLIIYLAAFVIDSFTWQLALIDVPLDATWLYRTWKARMVGEAFNYVIPAGGMGGEPVKAVLLKKYYGIGYRQGTASLILGKTVNMIALVTFLAGGFALMLGAPLLPPSYKVVAGVGLAAVALGTFLFFVIQWLKFTSIAGTRLSSWRYARRVEDWLHHVRDVDERLSSFYTTYRGRFAWAVALALVNWLLGVLEIYYTMIFLGHPMTLAEAWIIEAVAQMVRTGTFFIPASIGAQEGAFLLVCGAMSGSPTLGVAVALIRRFREIVWILWGFLLASLFSVTPAFGDE